MDVEKLRQDLTGICTALIDQRCSAGPTKNIFASLLIPRAGGSFEDANEAVIICKRGNPIFETLMQILRQSNADLQIAKAGHGPKPKIEIANSFPPNIRRLP